MYEELVKRLRNDAREQECLLHVCNSTMNAAEAADAIDALEKQLAESQCNRRTQTLPVHRNPRRARRDGSRCQIVEKQLAERESEIVRIRNSWSNTISDLSGVAAERDKYKASLDQIENIAVGFMESGPCESEALSGLWLVNRVISLALAPARGEQGWDMTL